MICLCSPLSRAHRLLSAQLTGHTLSNAASPLTLLQVECEWGNPGMSRGSGRSGDDDDDDDGDGECGPGKKGTTRQSVATGALANRLAKANRSRWGYPQPAHRGQLWQLLAQPIIRLTVLSRQLCSSNAFALLLRLRHHSLRQLALPHLTLAPASCLLSACLLQMTIVVRMLQHTLESDR